MQNSAEPAGSATPASSRSAKPLQQQPHRDLQVQQLVAELGLGDPLEGQASSRPWWMYLVGLIVPLGCGAMLLFSGTPWPQVLAAVLGLFLVLAVIVTVILVWGRRSSSKILLFTHGLVIPRTDTKPPLGARWEAVRLMQAPGSSPTDEKWQLMVPGGGTHCSGEVARDIQFYRAGQVQQALRVIGQGGEWNFSGWLISRDGLRLPSGAYGWDQLEFALQQPGRSLITSGSDVLQAIRRSDGQIIEKLELEDASLFFTLAPAQSDGA